MFQGRILASKLLKKQLSSVQIVDLCIKRQFSACLSQLKLNLLHYKHLNQTTTDCPSTNCRFLIPLISSERCKRQYCLTAQAKQGNLGALAPEEFVDILAQHNIHRGFVIYNETTRKLEPSHPELQELADRLGAGEFQFEGHEGIFLARGSRSNCLLCVFLWKTNRGQGSGGVDFVHIENMKDLLTEGHRMSKNLGIKCSLAGIWAGGGKGIIAVPKGTQYVDPRYRRLAYMDFGEFITSLNGCFIAGLGVGTSMADMEDMYSQTRYVSNLSTDLGGTGLTALYTGLGVVKSMEAALDYLGMGSLEGKRVCIQGAGLVGQVIVEELLKKGAKHIFVAESNQMRVHDVIDRFALEAEDRLEVSKVSFEDTGIFSRKCDIFSPCARGRVLNKTTIPLLQAKIVCGASNYPVDRMEDYDMFRQMGILYTSDVVPNRMGMVTKLVEPYGRLENDPVLYQHLSEDWEYSIYQTTLRILRFADKKDISPERAAYEVGEELGSIDHPLYPHRAKDIIRGLIETGWHHGHDFWRDRTHILGETDLL